ncbi:MAG: transposase [bacterium]|nr:transposase [bacterium]
MVRDIYLTDNINLATVLFGRPVSASLADDVPEIQALGRTLRKWWTEIPNHHNTGASNGPTEAMNHCIRKVKRAGHGFRCFDHYRLRVLLHTGGCSWDQLTPGAAPIRTGARSAASSTRRAIPVPRPEDQLIWCKVAGVEPGLELGDEISRDRPRGVASLGVA